MNTDDHSAARGKPFSQWKVFSAAWGVVLAFILSNSAAPLYVRWQNALHFSSGTLTDVFAAYIVGLLLSLLFVGQLSDFYGRKSVLIPGTVSALIACLLFMFSHHIPELLIARFLTGVYVGVISSAGMAAVVDLGGAIHRKQASLIASIAMVLGAAIGPVLAGSLSSGLNHPIFWVYLIQFVLFLSFLIIIFMLPLPVYTHAPKETQTFRFRLPTISPEYKRFVGVGLAVFGPGLTSTCFILSLGPSLLSSLLGVKSPVIFGGVAGMMFISAIVIQFVFKHFSLKSILLAGTFCTSLSMICMNLAVHELSLAPLIIAALFAGPGQGLGQLGGLTIIAFNVPERHRAESNALMNMGSYIPAGVLPVTAGYLTDATNLTTGASVFTIALLIMALAGGYYVIKALQKPFLEASIVV
ncbi:MFS transporter [Vibrio salinus]|uniref:MFS transporter n=1 Tax=Vibrio salinus TaxID=2899784 RepID=UPI001E587E09|nr:MFS transporter [Vibrio salinus]MCE0492742.1 MFS transporter [Vibrio salinus]